MSAIREDQRQAARDRIELFARSMFAIKGLGSPDMNKLSPLIEVAVQGLSPREMHHPDDITPSSLGSLYMAILDANNPKRPFNIYGADAPGAGKGSGSDGQGFKTTDLYSAASRGNLPARSTSDSSDGARATGASGRYGGDYQVLDLNSPQSLQQLTGTDWGKTAASLPYARAGIDFGTVKDLRRYDPSLTGKDVLKAASDTKQLGFDPNDKPIMRDQAVIRHYDNDPDATFEAEKKYKAGVEGDKDMQELLRQRGQCNDPVQQKVLDAKIERQKKSHMDETGLQGRADAPGNHPKAKAAIKDFAGEVVHRMQERYHHVNLEHGKRAAAELSDSPLKGERPATDKSAAVQDKSVVAFKKQDIASLSKNDQDDWGTTAKSEPAKPAPNKVAAVTPPAAPKPT